MSETPGTPAGWYDDPYPSAHGAAGLRYWDGGAWTQHTAPHPNAPVATRPVHPAAPYYASGTHPTTPDGVPLAGWGRRFTAYLVDALITLLAGLAIGFPFVRRMVNVFLDYIDAATRAAEQGSQPPSQLSLYDDLGKAFLGYTLVAVAVSLVYHAGFLRWRSATPGKLLLGLRVRLRETPGPLSWGTVLKRWLADYGVSLFGIVPFVGYVTGLYKLLDGLWPLWDDKRQALHDKFAGTNVVMRS